MKTLKERKTEIDNKYIIYVDYTNSYECFPSLSSCGSINLESEHLRFEGAPKYTVWERTQLHNDVEVFKGNKDELLNWYMQQLLRVGKDSN
jgi:hypothetical protein